MSQICNLICLPSMLIMRAPNSTPMVRSCTGWNLLSVNCNSKHDLPTPACNAYGCQGQQRVEKAKPRRRTRERRGGGGVRDRRDRADVAKQGWIIRGLNGQSPLTGRCGSVGIERVCAPVSPMMMYLNRYLRETIMGSRDSRWHTNAACTGFRQHRAALADARAATGSRESGVTHAYDMLICLSQCPRPCQCRCSRCFLGSVAPGSSDYFLTWKSPCMHVCTSHGTRSTCEVCSNSYCFTHASQEVQPCHA